MGDINLRAKIDNLDERVSKVEEKIINPERSVATLTIPSDVTYTSSNTHDAIKSLGIVNIRYQIIGYVGTGNYQTIGTLPNDYKLKAEVLKRICVAGNLFGYLRVKTNGEIQISIDSGTNTSLYINEVFLI